MEKLYRKTKTGRYQEAGYIVPDLCPGLYFYQKTDFGSRSTSVAYWLGNVEKEPVDLGALIKILKNDSALSRYLSNICQEGTPEYENLQESLGRNLRQPPKIFNIGMQDLSVAILRFIYNRYREEEFL